MIQFTRCNISFDGKTLNVGGLIESLSYYENVYIDKIVIDNENSYSISGPSANPVYTKTIDGNNKEVNLSINYSEIGNGSLLNGNLFFVWIISKGVPLAGSPYTDINKLLCLTFNEAVIYNTGMYYIRELRNKCTIPREFISWILDRKALDLAIKTGNYSDAVEVWQRMYALQTSLIPLLDNN